VPRRIGIVATLLLCLFSMGAGTRDQRADALRRARVWTAVPVEQMDLKAGPDDSRGFPLLATVA
jgi:hypothetical protein